MYAIIPAHNMQPLSHLTNDDKRIQVALRKNVYLCNLKKEQFATV